MDPATLQIQSELESSIQRAFNSGRPILTHLNGDTTWLLQIPYPKYTAPPSGRSHFNILIDPWLTGPQSDVAGWFSTQWHVVASSVQTIAELNETLRETNNLIQNLSYGTSTSDNVRSFIDAVAISHEFTDHCHKATLMEVDPLVPVFATERAAELIRSWNHFKTVHVVPSFSPENSDWRATSLQPLPNWIGISRVISTGNALYYHSALLIAFSTDQSHMISKSDHAEAVIYSPHGIAADELRVLEGSNPEVRALALLHGLHDVGISPFIKQLNLGAFNGLRAQRISQAKYWVGTHDEVKKGGGLIAPFSTTDASYLVQGVGKEEADGEAATNSDVAKTKAVINFVDLRSGESLVLA